jgi:hypothetical protein
MLVVSSSCPVAISSSQRQVNAGRAEPLDTVAGDNDYGDGTSGGAHRRQPSFNSPPGTSSLPAKSSP